MCVKQFLAAGVTAVLLLGLLGAGAGPLFSAQAAKGQAAPAERPPGAAGPAQGAAARKAADKGAEPQDLLRAQRDRMLIEEQKLAQGVDAALRKARATAPNDPEAALKLLRETLLQVWDHPDVGERLRNALLTRLLAAGGEQRGEAVPQGAFAWGQPHNGLRVGLAQEGPGRAGGVRVAFALENVGKDDLCLRLGVMRGAGKQFPSELAVTLTDAQGRVRTLRRTISRVAGWFGLFVVPLPAGSGYTLRYDLADVVDVDQDPAVVGVPWTPGRHRAAVEFVGKAVARGETSQNMAGLTSMRYWTGTARSGELVLTLSAGRK
jgi:hypothetical protein